VRSITTFTFLPHTTSSPGAFCTGKTFSTTSVRWRSHRKLHTSSCHHHDSSFVSSVIDDIQRCHSAAGRRAAQRRPAAAEKAHLRYGGRAHLPRHYHYSIPRLCPTSSHCPPSTHLTHPLPFLPLCTITYLLLHCIYMPTYQHPFIIHTSACHTIFPPIAFPPAPPIPTPTLLPSPPPLLTTALPAMGGGGQHMVMWLAWVITMPAT